MRRPVLAALLGALLLVGCWDRQEINDVAFVAATAIDREGEGYRVSVQIPLPGGMGQNTGQQGAMPGSGAGAGGRAWYVDSVVGKTVRDANDQLQKAASRQLFFGHRRVLIFSEEVAREGLAETLDVLARVPQNRLSSFLVISRGSAREALAVQAPGEQMPNEMQREMAQAATRTPPTLRWFLQNMLDAGTDPVLPVIERRMTEPGAEGTPASVVRLSGLAIFRRDRLVGVLTEKEAEGLLWAMGEARNPSAGFVAPGKTGMVFLQFQELRSQVIPVLQGQRLSMLIRVRAKGTLVENTSLYASRSPANLNTLADAVAKQLVGRVLKATRKLQTEFAADPIGFGAAVRRRYPAYWHRISQTWPEHYAALPVRAEANVIVEHMGTPVRPFGNLWGEVRR